MTMEKKFITIDLKTGQKILETLQASYIKFSDDRLPDSVNNLNDALKAEITRALAAEQLLTSKLETEIQRAKDAEEAIENLIGDLDDDSVKEAVDRLKALIDALTSTVTDHTTNKEKHITSVERDKWNQAAEDLKGKADSVHQHAISDVTGLQDALDSKVVKAELISGDGKIKTNFLPSIAVNTVHTVTNVQAAMDLKIENGDVVIINPNAQEVKTKDTVITGTFICVDAEKEEFEEKFRQLYSNADYISKGEVDKLIQDETDRAVGIENGLQTQITNQTDENHSGSLASKIKDNKEAIATETIAREAAIQTVTDKIAVINGEDGQEGSIKHAVKVEQTRAEKVEKSLGDRISVVEPIVTKLNGDKNVEGSAAKLADTALQEANEYTDGQIRQVTSSANLLNGRVNTLEKTVGGSSEGLVKDVQELQNKVNVINGSADGSIAKAQADAQAYTDTKVTAETNAREKADTLLQEKIDALEASEEFKVNLRFEGAEVSDVLAIRADGQIVKATLKDSSVVGIVVDANGANAKTAVMGRVGGFSGLVPGKSYFLGSDGRITPTMPTGVGEHIIKVGVALTTTELFVNIQEAIEIRA